MIVFRFRLSLLIGALAYFIMPDTFLKRDLKTTFCQNGHQMKLRRIFKDMTYKECLIFENKNAEKYEETLKSPNQNKQ